MEEARSWAGAEFGHADLGDERRRYRLVRMAAALGASASGTVADVFGRAPDLQAAYDFLSNEAVRADAILAATAQATARRCQGHEHAIVVVDGTTLTLRDRSRTKPLGRIGGHDLSARGLKVVDAYAVTPDGVPAGILDLKFWARPLQRPKETSRYKRRRNRTTEMRYWSAAVQSATDVLATHAPNVRPWFVMDREADEAALLREMNAAEALFTVRAAQNRIVERNGKLRKLFSVARAVRPVGVRQVQLAKTWNRTARIAKLELRVTKQTLLLPTYLGTGERTPVEVGVIDLREVGSRRDRVHWVLLTNASVESRADIDRVIDSYVARWRVEEFHRTWKSGGCDVEETRLRSAAGIRKWAILLAAVAVRTERLRYLSRTQPDAPATAELTEDEILALILAKRRIKNTIEEVPDGIPTIRTATRWIGDLGGYAGRYKGYEPGAVVLSRGLAKLAIWVEAVQATLAAPEIQKKLR
jgi:hypothetical protein